MLIHGVLLLAVPRVGRRQHWGLLPGWLAKGEGQFIIWMTMYRAELPQGTFLSALLKVTFCRDHSGEKRFLVLKISA